MKKLVSLILAIMMIAMVGAAWAEVTVELGTESSSNTINIPKEIVLFNTTAGTPIYEPNVTYTYALTAPTVGTATITDDPAVDKYDSSTTSSVTVQVKQGTGGVTITGTDNVAKGVGEGDINIVFGDGAHDTTASYAYTTLAEGATVSSDTTAKATRNIVVTVDPTSTAFQKTADGLTTYVPGVYRYHIAETSTVASINASGVKTPTGRLTNLTLDIYLKWNAAKTGLEVYGYVLFRDLTENENLSYASSGATTAKVTGFDVPSNMEGADHDDITSTCDEYHTFNTTITKTVSGNLADKNNAFPFAIALTGIENSEFYYTRTGSSASRNTTVANGLKTMTSGSASITSDLKDGENITLFGLPYNATVGVTETNNTPDYYTPSALFDTTNITSNLTLSNSFNPSGTAATAVYYNDMTAAASITLNRELTADTIAFTNTLTEISPTGYVSRYAPYALILVAGVVLLVLAKKHKREPEEE